MKKQISIILATLAIPFVNVTAKDNEAKKDVAAKKIEIDVERLKDVKHPLQPMLWKVEGNGLEKPSYLFGSMHVSDKRVVTLHPLAEEAYQSADTLATEVEMNLRNQMESMRLMMRKEGTLKDAIGEDLHEKLSKVLEQANAPMNAASMNSMKTWAVILIIGMLEEMSTGKDPLDSVLWKRAGKDKKGQWALETNQEQMGGFDALTNDELNVILKDTLDALLVEGGEDVMKQQMNDMKHLYLMGDDDKLIQYNEAHFKESNVDKKIADKFMKIIMDDRNARMAATIEKKFKAEPKKSHFMVAGTLHYVGKNNVGELLKAKGYKVTRIVETN